MLTKTKSVSGNRRSVIKTDEATVSSSASQQPVLRLRKSKTKLIKMERNFSFKREDIARMVREICDEKGIEYPNKAKLSKHK